MLITSTGWNSWNAWLPIVISGISLTVALFSAWVTLQGYLRGRQRLVITQAPEQKSAVIIEPEWDKGVKYSPDVYTDRRYRILIEVSIRNQSSNPIAISRFTLNNRFAFGPYSRPGTTYQVETRAQMHKTPDGGTMFGPSEKSGFPLDGQFLQPVLHLKPFDIVKGYLFWPAFDSDMQYINVGGSNTLTLETTFKDIETTVHINELVSRDPELPKREDWNETEITNDSSSTQ